MDNSVQFNKIKYILWQYSIERTKRSHYFFFPPERDNIRYLIFFVEFQVQFYRNIQIIFKKIVIRWQRTVGRAKNLHDGLGFRFGNQIVFGPQDSNSWPTHESQLEPDVTDHRRPRSRADPYHHLLSPSSDHYCGCSPLRRHQRQRPIGRRRWSNEPGSKIAFTLFLNWLHHNVGSDCQLIITDPKYCENY